MFPNTYYFSTHCWVVRRRGAIRDLRAVRLCVRTQRSLLSPASLAHTLLTHRPSPAACTHLGGTTYVHYTRRIRLDVFFKKLGKWILKNKIIIHHLQIPNLFSFMKILFLINHLSFHKRLLFHIQHKTFVYDINI